MSLVAGGHHVCALLVDGDVTCWGANDKGQLGLGNMINVGDDAEQRGDNFPVVQLGNLRVVSLAAGKWHTCALLVESVADRRIKCWGYNHKGQLGLGDALSRGHEEVERIGDVDDFWEPDLGQDLRPVSITAGEAHTCAVLSPEDGGREIVKCWGRNHAGQLGLGERDETDVDDESGNPIGDQPGEMGDELSPIDMGN